LKNELCTNIVGATIVTEKQVIRHIRDSFITSISYNFA